MKSLRRWLSSSIFPAALTLGAGLALHSARAGEWTSSVALTSDYRVHGLQRSAGEPAAQAHLGIIDDRGWSAGIWGSTVELHSGPGPRQEIDFYAAAYSQLSRDWRLTAQLTHYEFLNDSPFLSYDYTELVTTASFRDALAASIAVIPQYSLYSNGVIARGERAMNFELSGRRPLNRNVQLIAGVGHSDLQALFGAGYWYWNAGAELGFRRVRLAVSYVGTDSSAKYLFGQDSAGDAWVATLAYRLF